MPRRSVLALALALFAATAAAQDRHADPGLEAMLPTSLGGSLLDRESQSGTELAATNAAFAAFLAGLDSTPAEFTVASALPRGNLPARIGAWRVAGAEEVALLEQFVEAVRASSAVPITVGMVVLADRDITWIGADGELAGGTIHAFAEGDSVLYVQTSDPKLAEEAIALLAP